MRFAVLASGNGSNFEAIATAWEQKQIPGELALVFANHPEAYVLERAAQHQIPHFRSLRKSFVASVARAKN